MVSGVVRMSADGGPGSRGRGSARRARCVPAVTWLVAPALAPPLDGIMNLDVRTSLLLSDDDGCSDHGYLGYRDTLHVRTVLQRMLSSLDVGRAACRVGFRGCRVDQGRLDGARRAVV